MATPNPVTDPMGGTMVGSTTVPTTPDPGCDNPIVKLEYWVYATLPISISIIVLFALLEERVRLWPNCFYKRPGLAYPVNLVDNYEDRWSFASAFSVMSTSILLLFFGEWFYNPDLTEFHVMIQGTLRIFVALANVLLICLVFYPLLLCLRTQHKVLGNSIGFVYNNIWLIYNLMKLNYCARGEYGLDRNTTIAQTVPVYINYTFLDISFAVGLYQEIKKRIPRGQKNTVQTNEEEDDYFLKTHYYERVKYLFSRPKQEEEVSRLTRIINKIWIPAPGFRYSTRNICTIVLSTITTYQVGLLYISGISDLWAYPKLWLRPDGVLYKTFAAINATSYIIEAGAFFDIAENTFWGASYFAITLAVLYSIHVQICYREQTLLLWKGSRDFCPKEKFSFPALVVANLRYSGYAIAFSAWGFLITQFVSWLLLFFVAYFIIHQLMRVDQELTWLLRFLEGYWLTFVMGFVFYYLQVAFANLTFLQKEKEKKKEIVHLSLNNRRLFHLTVYVLLFLNVIVGLVSCLMRIVKAVFFGVLFIGRLDRCTLMRGFELWDPGFKSYLGFLQLEVAHTHPVLITFCHFLWKSVGKDMREKKTDLFFCTPPPRKGKKDDIEITDVADQERPRKKLWPRNKWFVALTLMRNRTLTVDRMQIAPELQQVKEELQRERQAPSNGNATGITIKPTEGTDSPAAAEAGQTNGACVPANDEDKVSFIAIENPPNQVSTTAEISPDPSTASPDPDRPATRLSMVAWDEHTKQSTAKPNVHV